ncbi:MAG: hypothetical protein QOC73_592, partial [Actinomycetota bacterium]|nr:hypothetical protein [Actinomycetota bacterium]
QNPAATDELNAEHLLTGRIPRSPLGDPVPFSAYLIGRLANPTGYDTQFNLDSDRAYAYLTWDWIRGADPATSETGFPYNKPLVPPANADGWVLGGTPMQLRYVDTPAAPPSPRRRRKPVGQPPPNQPPAGAPR